jgi:hypothetical protein
MNNYGNMTLYLMHSGSDSNPTFEYSSRSPNQTIN